MHIFKDAQCVVEVTDKKGKKSLYAYGDIYGDGALSRVPQDVLDELRNAQN